LTELEQVAGKFRIQLQHITGQTPVNKVFFAERLRASSSYFTEKIETLLRTLQESTATTDSKANAQEYDEDIVSLFRNRISKEENLPVYIVASVKTLVQMADYLPETEKELLRIHGFGKVKTERFGAKFLELIQNYIAAYGIESRMIHFKEDKKPRKRKNKG
jgi:superfamily II DNA helicase RecQ